MNLTGLRRSPATWTTACLWLSIFCGSSGWLHADWKDEIRRLALAHQGHVAIVVKHLPSGEQLDYRADERMPTASLIKLPILIHAYQEAAKQNVDLLQSIELTDGDRVPGSGILTSHFSPGLKLSLRDALRLMIVYSDNTATNLVLDQLGIENVNAAMSRLECPQTRLHAKVYRRDTSVDPAGSKQFGLGVTTAHEITRLLERLAGETLADPATCNAIIEHLAACDDDSKLARGLPAGVPFAHKTGAVNRSRCDAGIVSLHEGRLILCVLTTNNRDTSWTDDNDAHVLCERVARIAYTHFAGEEDREGAQDPEQASTLKSGAHGVLVEDLQRTLNARLKGVDLAVDGDFGPNTANALRQFQKSAGLPESGEVDEATWQALGALVTEDPPVPPLEELRAALPDRLEAEPLDTPPLVTCKAYAIARPDGSIIAHQQGERSLPMASTTKIMTAYLVLEAVARDESRWNETVTFSQRADKTPGSTSGLRAGERLPVKELIYGLMLPSGNDASVALAEHFGEKWLEQGETDPLDAFIARMNDAAERLGMTRTHFENPHGLTAEGHEASATDLLNLAQAAWKLPHFQEIVNTRVYATSVSSEQGYSRRVAWRNTNRLLSREGYRGVKTGTTRAAGACLVSYGERAGKPRFIVVLGSANSDARYVDTRNLFRWSWSQMQD